MQQHSYLTHDSFHEITLLHRMQKGDALHGASSSPKRRAEIERGSRASGRVCGSVADVDGDNTLK